MRTGTSFLASSISTRKWLSFVGNVDSEENDSVTFANDVHSSSVKVRVKPLFCIESSLAKYLIDAGHSKNPVSLCKDGESFLPFGFTPFCKRPGSGYLLTYLWKQSFEKRKKHLSEGLSCSAAPA
jgi:hypothetical protein